MRRENFAERAARLAAAMLRLLKTAGDTAHSNIGVSEGTRSGEPRSRFGARAEDAESIAGHSDVASRYKIRRHPPTSPRMWDDGRYRRNGPRQTRLRHLPPDNQFNEVDGGIVASIVVIFALGFAFHWLWIVIPGIGVVLIIHMNIRDRHR